MILAIIQKLPTHPTHVVRTDSFAKFQQICGMLEQESYLAAHAACHATMNGIERTLAVDADISNRESLHHAVDAIFGNGPFDALVIPGLTDFELQNEVCAWCQPHRSAFQFSLYLDAPRSCDIARMIEHQQTLPRFAKHVWPWISTVTPGRRSAEYLPASCVITALAQHKAEYLRGVHDLSALNPNDLQRLAENEIEILIPKTVQRRPVVARYETSKAPVESTTPRPAFIEVPGVFAKSADDPEPVNPNEAIIEREISEELQRRCDDLIRQYPSNGPQLWSALQRTSFAVLNEAKSRGKITNFHCRCDAETASWGTAEKPVVEVLIEYPKRVKEIKFNWK